MGIKEADRIEVAVVLPPFAVEYEFIKFLLFRRCDCVASEPTFISELIAGDSSMSFLLTYSELLYS